MEPEKIPMWRNIKCLNFELPLALILFKVVRVRVFVAPDEFDSNGFPCHAVIGKPYASIASSSKRLPKLIALVGFKEEQVFGFPRSNGFIEDECKLYLNELSLSGTINARCTHRMDRWRQSN